MIAKFFLKGDAVLFSFVGPVTVVGSPPLELEVVASEQHKKSYPNEWKAFVAEHPQFLTEEEKKKAAEVAVFLANREAAKSEALPVEEESPKSKKKAAKSEALES